MTMHFRVVHTTRISYDGGVAASYNLARMTPLTSGQQVVVGTHPVVDDQCLAVAVQELGCLHLLPGQPARLPDRTVHLHRGRRGHRELAVLVEHLERRHLGAPVVAVGLAPRRRRHVEPGVHHDLVLGGGRRHPRQVVRRGHPAVVRDAGGVHDTELHRHRAAPPVQLIATACAK